jgi:magnesium transporter
MKHSIRYADDDKVSIKNLLILRTPSLVLGLLLGLVLTFVTSRFEQVLSEQIALAFFIPFVVYMSDAVGTQTQSIYTRDLKTGKANFKTYLFKESAVGIILGVLFSLVTIFLVQVWFHANDLAIAVGLGLFVAIASAPLIALVVSELLQIEREDPAVWAGPIATIIQDAVSVVIYGFIATAIFL